jgi:glycosyltransferase involved in cell wall biosynthesis
MNKRLLYIVEDDIAADKGSSINERNLIKYLLQNDVYVLIPAPKYYLDPCLLNHEKVYITKSVNRRNIVSYMTYMVSKIYNISKITRKENIDIYVFRWGLIPVDILFLNFFTRKKIYLKHLTFLRTSQKDGLAFKISALFRKIIIKTCNIYGSDTPSVATKQLVINEYNINNVLLAKNGTESIKNIHQNRIKDFVYIGWLSKRRNTDILLKIFEESDKRIDIFGFGDMVSIVKDYAKRNGNINFYGKIEYNALKKELPKYKYGIDLTYVPTKYGKASFSQKIAQYLSFGLNVIAIECEDNAFIEKNNVGVLVDLEKDNLESKINNMSYKLIKTELIKEHIYNECIVKQRLRFWNR